MRTFFVSITFVAATSMQAPSATEEQGTFLLHFLRQPVGEETYQLTQDDHSLVLHASFLYTERGSRVPLNAALRMKPDLTPVEFVSKGKSYRPFSVDASVTVEPDGRRASVREGENTRQVAVPERFFTLSGYNPFSVQMMMMRYWLTHGKPEHLSQFPAATPDTDVSIAETGHDIVTSGGKQVRLTRYSVSNVVWGNESVWLSGQGQLAAATTYAGGLPFEAVQKEYQEALPQLIRSADSDRLRELMTLSAAIQPIAKGRFAIAASRLMDGTNATPVNDAVVLIDSGKIIAAGPRAKVAIPKGVAVIEAHDATLLPGLWEMHAHFAQVDYGPAYLAAGVTTARDCGGEFPFITAVRDVINQQRGLGPHLMLAGLVDRSGEGTFGTIWADTPEQGRALVRKYKAASFAQIKIYTRIQPDVLSAIATEAHLLGITVTGHVPQGMTMQEAVLAGMDQINHFGPVLQAVRAADSSRPVQMDSLGVKRVIQFLLERHTVVDPTMAWGELLGRPINQEISAFEPGYAKAPYTLTSVIGTAGSPPTDKTYQGVSNESALLLRTLYRAGVPIVAGTDKALPGHSFHRELELYHEAGLTPSEVIQLATSGSAKVMGMEREVGTIEPGKRADLILVDGDPLQDFASLRKVTRVVTKGRMYEVQKLWRSVGFRP